MPNRRTLLSNSISQIARYSHPNLDSTTSPNLFRALATIAGLGLVSITAQAVDNTTGYEADDSIAMQNSSDIAVTYFPEIVVTATRLPTLVSNTIAQTHVVDEEELKRYQGETLLEVLKKQPGISFKQDGGMGQSANFYIRGYDSKRVLVLIDGMRYGSATTGQPAIQLLPADQIDRIEILYGASGSSIYGSDAIGGVIQIFTKGASAIESNFSINAGYGSNDHYKYGGTAQWVNNNTKISVSGSRNKTDGISAQAYQTGNNKDDDGYESNNGAVYISTDVNDAISLGTSVLYSESTTEFDNYGNDKDAYIDQKNGAYTVFGQYINGKDSLKLTIGQSLDDVDNNVGDKFETTQTQANLIGTYALPIGVLLAGAEWLNQEVDIINGNTSNSVNSQVTKNNRDIKSGFVGYQLAGINYDVQANLRLDDNSQFDTETTYGIGASYDINDTIRVGANYATGYRAPTINDLYVSSAYYTPNPNLKVETSDNIEAFIEFNTYNQRTRITGFMSDTEDMINSEYNANTFKYDVLNLDEVSTEGLSFQSDWFIDDYLMGLQYSYIDTVNESGANKGKQLVYRPKHSGMVYTGYQGPNFDIRGELEYVGERYNAHDNSTKLDSYELLNISGNYYLSPQLTLTTRINNLLNEDYATNAADGQYRFKYNHDGINYWTALTYKWK